MIIAGSLLFGSVAIAAPFHGVKAGRDKDRDGMDDSWEFRYDVTSPKGDPDHDGLINLLEYRLGSHPRNPDSDNDGLDDGDEYQLKLDPKNPDCDDDGELDGEEDTDNDGIENEDEDDPQEPACCKRIRMSESGTVYALAKDANKQRVWDEFPAFRPGKNEEIVELNKCLIDALEIQACGGEEDIDDLNAEADPANDPEANNDPMANDPENNHGNHWNTNIGGNNAAELGG